MSSHKHTTEETIAIWRSRIERGKEIREQEDSNVWDKNMLAFRGQLRPDEGIWAKGDPWVSVELVHSSIRASIPSLLYSNPEFSISPKKPIIENGQDMSWERAFSKKLWLDHTWGETQGNEHVRLAVTSAFIAFGCCKVGYHPDFADDELRGELDVDAEGNLTIEGKDSKTGRDLPRLTKGEFLRDNDGDIIWDEDTGLPLLHPGELVRERYFVEWVPFSNMIFDPEGGSVFANHKWVCEEIIRPLDEVKNDPRYKTSVRKRIKATDSVGAEAADDSPQRSASVISTDIDQTAADEDGLRVRIFTIYDFQANRVYELAEGVEDGSNDKFLLDNPMPRGMEHGPYVFLRFNYDPGKFYPRTDAEAMGKVEITYNLLQSQMLTHRNQSKARYLEAQNQGFTDDIEREKFRSGPNNAVCTVKDPNAIQPARKDALDGNFFTAVPNILQDFNQVAGQSGEQRGVADAETATQASILSSGADLRNSDRRDNLVQKFISDIGRKLLQAAAVNLDTSTWVKIARPEDPQPFEFKEITPDDLEGEFETDVVMGSTQAKNSSNRVAMLEKIVLLFSQNPLIAAAPTLVRRIMEAIDIQDPKLIQELQQIGQQVLKAQTQPDQGSGGGGASTQSLPNDIVNQFVNAASGAAGSTTGAPTN